MNDHQTPNSCGSTNPSQTHVRQHPGAAGTHEAPSSGGSGGSINSSSGEMESASGHVLPNEAEEMKEKMENDEESSEGSGESSRQTGASTLSDPVRENEEEEERTNRQIAEMNLIASPLNRVKLYHLNESGQWDDMGTGHVRCDFVEAKEAVCLVLISESTPEEPQQRKLLESKISRDDIYQLQGDSLIVWSDPETGVSSALSFQESDGCCQIWDEIRVVQGREADGQDVITRNRLQEAEGGVGGMSSDDDDYFVDENGDDGYRIVGGGLHGSDEHFAPVELPEPTLSTLKNILSLVSVDSMYTKEGVRASIIQNPSYLDKLFDVFEMAESMKDTESLHMLYSIFKHIVLLDDNRIFNKLFSEKYFMKLMGVLEYDPDLRHTDEGKANHRERLNDMVAYRKVIDFSDPAVESKIHQSFRVNYLKDAVLPKVLDDATFTTLNTIVHINNLAIIRSIRNDTRFLEELFEELKQECQMIQAESTNAETLKLMAPSGHAEVCANNSESSPAATDRPRRLELVRLLQEYNGMLKTVNNDLKNDVYSTLLKHGMLDCLGWLLVDRSASVRHASSDIVCSLISFEPFIVRKHILGQCRNSIDRRSRMLESILRIITSEPELGIQDNVTEAFKLLFDPELLAPETKDEFLNIFYETRPSGRTVDDEAQQGANGREPYIAWLGKPFKRFDYCNSDHERHAKQRPLLQSSALCQSYTRILDIMGHFVAHHGFRMRNYVIRSRFLLLASNLLATSGLFRKDVSLSVIRFIRTCMSHELSSYAASIVEHDVFRPVVDIWQENGDRYNLINSSIIELFESVRLTNRKSLIRYAVEQFRDIFETVHYVDTFKVLVHKYEITVASSTLESNGDNTTATAAPADNVHIPHNVRAFMERQPFDEQQDRWFESDDNDTPKESEEEVDANMAASGASGTDMVAATAAGEDVTVLDIPDMIFPPVADRGSDEDEDGSDDEIGDGQNIFATTAVSSGVRTIDSVSRQPPTRPGTPIKPPRPSLFTISISTDSRPQSETLKRDAVESEVCASTTAAAAADDDDAKGDGDGEEEEEGQVYGPEPKRRKVELVSSVESEASNDNSGEDFERQEGQSMTMNADTKE